MKKGGIHKNNRGDSLILVIGSIALLSILGIVILSKTMDNQTMKLEEDKAQKSFFEADSSSSEIVTVLESMAQEAIENAFYDMMIEYSKEPDGEKRKERFATFFARAFEENLPEYSTVLQTKLESAVNGDVSDVSITIGHVDAPTSAPAVLDKTNEIRVEDVVLTYTANGTKTTIQTDICIQAKIPDVEAGFRTSVPCDFSDFALITDSTATVTATSTEKMKVNGNLYVGQDLNAGASTDHIHTTSGWITVNDAAKMLVRKNIVIENNSGIKVTNSGTLTNGQGIWANGISVYGGELDTTNVNLYVSDDLTIEGNNANVSMRGADAEYLGYSGCEGASLQEHQKSSAITINHAKNLTLDLSNMKKLSLNGNSYICDKDWKEVVDGVHQEIDGVLQGESVAYKDMQAMYLVPGECLSVGHNPVLGEEAISMTSEVYSFQGPHGIESIDLSLYLNPSQKFVTRVARLEGGTTKATYVYMNFENEERAAEYVKAYLSTSKGDAIKAKINNLGTGSVIKLPSNTSSLSNALTYDGSTVTMLAPANDAKKNEMSLGSLMAKQRYRGLFSKLSMGGGVIVGDSYLLLEEGILAPNILDSATNEVIEVDDPADGTKKYKFVMHKGSVTIDEYSPYFAPTGTLNGILLVDGDVNIVSSNIQVNGLVLATGNVNVSAGTTLNKDSRAVETLLTDPGVAKYFSGYAHNGTQQYLSSEAVDISFKNWKRN